MPEDKIYIEEIPKTKTIIEYKVITIGFPEFNKIDINGQNITI
jgi:hypothetical protein